jgi:hypothetical protein
MLRIHLLMKSASCDKWPAGLFATALLLWGAASPHAAEAPLHALLIGGGPDTDGNGAEIESHLRYAAQLLPPGTNCFVHFTDGKPRAKTVSFTDSAKLKPGRRALNVLLPDNDFGPETETRPPKLGVKINGETAPANPGPEGARRRGASNPGNQEGDLEGEKEGKG